MTHQNTEGGYALMIGIIIAAFVIGGGAVYYLRTPVGDTDVAQTPLDAIDAARETAAMLEEDAQKKQ